MSARLFKIIVALLTLNLVLAVSAFAVAPWSLFGNARSVKEGEKPDSWAVELSSVCPENTECLGGEDPSFSGVQFSAPNRKLSFESIRHLSVSYKMKAGDCAEGSPRFLIGIDTDGDSRADGDIHVYLLPQPDFVGCNLPNEWQSTGNLIDSTETLFDVSDLIFEKSPFSQEPHQGTGPLFMSYSAALHSLGDLAAKTVLYVKLIVDGGVTADQVIVIDGMTINNFKLTG
jgi:hypothetical protein